MTSLWCPRSSALLIAGASVTLQTSSAAAHTACGDDIAMHWQPQRSWPAACEADVPTDGLVLLEGDALPAEASAGDGQMQVELQRMVAGAAVETVPGKLTRLDATAALFKSDRPLSPQAAYQITALHVDLDGSPLGDKFTSAFSTGVRSLAPLAFASTATLHYEEADTERFDCVVDGCGQKHCLPGDETVHTKSVRIAVPPITGGVELRPYAVSAKLVASFSNGQAAAVATSDTAATQAGKRSFIVVELPALPSRAQGCVTINATDVAGHTVSSEPVCTALPADEQPYDHEVSAPKFGAQLGDAQTTEPALTSQADDNKSQPAPQAEATPPDTVEARAQGCSVGRGRGSAGQWTWLALALVLARLGAQRARTKTR